MHGVAMQVAGALPAAGGEAFGQHAHDRVEILARQLRVRPGAPHPVVQLVLVPFRARRLRPRSAARARPAARCGMTSASSSPRRTQSSSAAHSTRSSRDCGNRRALGHAADLVARAADALQQRGDRARRTELADQVDVADVDAQFQRRGRDQHLQFAALEPLLGVQPQFLRQAAVVRGDRVLAQPFGEVARDALGHAPRVDEDQRGAMRLDQFGEARRRPAPTARSTSPAASGTGGTSSARSRCRV